LVPLNTELTALIVTGENALARLATATLENLHFKPVVVSTDNEALEKAQADRPDILILDYSLPAHGGVEVCRRLRQTPEGINIPIIMLTAADGGNEKIESLDAGADCCISKPLQGDVLAAYVRALRRRSGSGIGREEYLLHAGPIQIDLGRWTVNVSGKPVVLTKIEFCLLKELLEAKGRTLTRDFLLQKVWPHGTIHGLDSRTVDVHIGRLRRKLGPAGRFIITVRNVGFRFDLLPDWITTHHAS
jgi:DNA-binding response OmpR family regulator